MKIDRILLTVVSLALVLAWSGVTSGCKKSTPPGPNSVFGIGFAGEKKHFQFIFWKEGLAIMIVDNIEAEHSSKGHSSTESPFHRQTGFAESAQGERYEWEIQTADGKTADIKIQNVEYDIAKGSVFVVHVKGERVSVDQIDLNLTNLATQADCRNFITKNSDVINRELQ